jgi:ketosteroid isomerase-like protein
MHAHNSPTVPAAESGYGRIEEQLVALDKQWGRASARGDAKALNRLLAANYTFTDLDGRVGTKAEMLRDLKDNQANRIESLEASNYKVQVYGTTAVMTHLTTATSGDSKVQLQSMHVWIKRGNSWQVLAHQWTAVLPSDSKVPALRPACAKYSYQPEIISYFGDSNTVIGKLENDQMGLPDRRGYLLLVEKKGSAELSFFERADANNFRVLQWKGESLGDLRENLTQLIFANRGIACVGEQTKMIVNASFHPEDRGTIPMPLSAKAAFSHILKKYGDDYLRVTILLLC